MRVEEVEHARRAVVARRIVGRAREPRTARPVGHAAVARTRGESVELREPPRHDRSKLAAGRHAQKAIPLAELAIFVAASHDERIVERFRRDGEGDDVEGVVRVDEERRPHAAAAVHHLPEPRHDVRVRVEDRRDHGDRRALVDGGRDPFGDRAGGRARHLDELDALFGEARELPAERVELGVGRDDAGPIAERQRREQANDEESCVLAARA